MGIGTLSRRRFLQGSLILAGTGLLAGCSFPVRQRASSASPARIGLLGNTPSRQWDAFLAQLGALDYDAGRNLTVESRWTEGQPERFPELVAQLLAAKVDVIVAAGNAAALAAKQATATTPVVFVGVGDPISNGIVESLARPGANLTGVSSYAPEVGPKAIELLRETAPGAFQLAVLVGPLGAAQTPIDVAARALGVQARLLTVTDPAGFDAAFAEATRSGADMLYVLQDPLFFVHRTRILDFAAQQRLPGMYLFREFVDEGGLLFHGTDLANVFRRGADYVDKILKGARPADLPVEQPTKFDFVISLKSASTLGLSVPPSVLAQATEVIQ
jgi:putative ABC transport system substrate-binding protein